MNNSYHFPNNNQNNQAGTQLNKDSQVYQPNMGYDMMGNMQHGNSSDWAANNARKLDRNSTVFIPGRAPSNQLPQNNMTSQQQKRATQPSTQHQQQSSASSSMINQQTGRSVLSGNQPEQIPGRASESRNRMPPQPSGRQGQGQYSELQQDSMNNSQHGQQPSGAEVEKVCQYILMLKDPTKKYDYFKLLNEQREYVPHLAQYLWYSTGTVSILLQEIINIYPNLSPPTLTQSHSERICNVLGLFQCIALHDKTKPLFIKANLHLYLYPLINKIVKQKPFEHLRVTSLGVIGALVKGEDTETIGNLINTELIVLCLRIMKKGNLLSRTVATFIVQKILMDENGLTYVCYTEERLLALAQILKDMTEEYSKDPASPGDKDVQRLLRHIVRCFLRLSENQNAIMKLVEFIPECFRSLNSISITKDEQIKKWLASLLKNLRL